MDRNRLLEILNKDGFNNDIITELLTEYCVVEHNKDATSTQQLIEVLFNMPMLIPSYINDVVNYYKVKFTIYELRDKKNNIIIFY